MALVVLTVQHWSDKRITPSVGLPDGEISADD